MMSTRSRRAKRLLTSAALLTAIACAVPGFVRAQDEAKPVDNATYTWTLKYKKGDIARIKEQGKLNLSANGMDFAVEVNSINKREVKEIATNGDVTIESKAEEAKINFNGQEIDNPEPDRKITQVFNKSGVVIKQKVENSQQAGSPIEKVGMLANSTPVPDKPVKIGDSWKTEMDNPLLEGKKVTITSKLLGKEKIGGVDTLTIKMEAAVPPKADATEKDSIKLVTTYYVDAQAGRIVRTKSTTDNAEFEVMGMALKVSGETLSNLLKPGEDVKKGAEKKDAK